MFYQVKVAEKHRSFLRFLWWEDSDINESIVDHEMCVHGFGGVSSPSSSNYALRKTASDNQEEYGNDAAETLRRNFYVDDLLKSVNTHEVASKLVDDVRQMCKAGGFHLTKYICNDKEVLATIPEEDRRQGVKNRDLITDSLPTERALGIHWNLEHDYLGFCVHLKETPATRRGMLSTVSSIYDPLGFVAPFILPGRKIIQRLCQGEVKWDDPVSCDIRKDWKEWKSYLSILGDITVNRCFKPSNFKSVKEVTLHHFSDASEEGYGQVSYLRLVDTENKIQCAFLMGKSRVALLKFVSIPGLELTAATLSVKISKLIRVELQYNIDKEYFWTDSQVVLGYLQNESKRFKVFVANRIQIIKEHSDVGQWQYVASKDNPADYASRGIIGKKRHKIDQWFNGPSFLWKDTNEWPPSAKIPEVDSNNDPEIKRVAVVNMVGQKQDILSILESQVSGWVKMKRVLALVMLFKSKLLSKISEGKT